MKPTRSLPRLAYNPIPEKVHNFWGPKTLQPTAIIAQLDVEYDTERKGIHPLERDGYVEKLLDTLRFAQKRRADFCVFPEYAWPVTAATRALHIIDKAPPDRSVYVLPFEHMDVNAYLKLLQKFRVNKGERDKEERDIRSRLTGPADKAIVNAAMIVLRSGRSTMVFPQRKLRPALLEESPALMSQFVTGNGIRIIQGDRCTFAVMICFDFIAQDDSVRARPRDLLADQDLDLLIVPECNPSPLHDFYLMSTIDLYQAPSWSRRRPLIVMANVGIGTRVGNYRFGFSRIIGNLGKVTESPELRYFKGYVAKNKPKALADLDLTTTHVRDDNTQTIVLRPEETVFVCELPTLGGGAKSRQAKDTDTNVFFYRPRGPHDQWRAVRDVPPILAGGKFDGIPQEFVVDAGDRRKKFDDLRRKILFATPLVWVKGGLGTGKTALVSTTLQALFKQQKDRIIWMDLSSIECSEEALVEHVLLQLGRPSDLAQSLDRQYEVVEHALQSRPTVLVLDSAHHWTQPLPTRLLDLHGWKTLLVVTARTEPAWMPKAAQIFDVERLELPEFTAMIKSIGKREPPQMLARAMFASSQGSALHAVWTGQLLARNGAEAEDLNRFISKEIGPVQPGVVPVFGGLPIPSEQLSFRIIDQWLAGKLNASALDLLAVLSTMPGGLREEDLRKILVDRTAIVSSLSKLEARNLVQSVKLDAYAADAMHSVHSFAREVWQTTHAGLDETIWKRVVDWARWVLGQYGRNRDPKLSSIVVNQWTNLAFVLDSLAARNADDAGKDFLALWSLADGFLWAAGRWRERLKFGKLAAKIAREMGDVDAEIAALFDAQAKTIWHRNGREGWEQAEALLARAADLADASGKRMLRARVEWYRSRMQLHIGETALALEVAHAAVALSDTSDDTETRVMARINLGNAFRENDDAQSAFDQYDTAETILDRETTAREAETRAVMLRSRGRAHMARQDFTEAIACFENAMDRFREQKLIVQEARTAVHYAEALSAIREPWTAEQFLRWGRQHLDPLGSSVMIRRIEAAQNAIAIAKQRRPGVQEET